MQPSQRTAWRSILQQIPFFSSLTIAEIDAVLQHATVQRLAPNAHLVTEGQPGSNVYVVLSGRLKVVSGAGSARELILGISGPGELLGELSMLDRQPRSASVIAIEPVRVLTLQRRELIPLLQAHPEAALQMIAALTQQIRQLSASLREQISLPLATRLARKLLHLAEAFGHPTDEGVLIDIHLSQNAIARMLGVSRESINKQLRVYRNNGVLTFRDGFVTVHSLDKLKQLGEV